MGLNFAIDMPLGRLVLLNLSKKRPKNQSPDIRGAGKWWLSQCTVAPAALWKHVFWDTLYTNRVLFPKLLILSQFFFGFLYWSTNDTSTGQPRSGDLSPDPGQQHCSYLTPRWTPKTTYWIGELDHVFFVIHIPPKNTRQGLLSGWFRGLR